MSKLGYALKRQSLRRRENLKKFHFKLDHHIFLDKKSEFYVCLVMCALYVGIVGKCMYVRF